MSRPRKADHATAIEAAQGVFWRNGYAGTSTRQIEESTGLTRFTLQTTYGGKEAFFLETLDAYLDKAEARYFPDPATTDLEGLAVWFEKRSSAEIMPEIGDQGCLIMNTISEFGRQGGGVDARVERYLTGLQSRFAQILTAAIDRKELTSDADPEDRARILVSLLLGLSLTIKARKDDAVAHSHTSAAAALIRGWL
jgi:TetR/AcrR family transcriptional repressor of nem operon